MYKFHNNLLPPVFNPYFNSIRMTHNYNTRLSSKMTYAIPKVRNYGIFNVRCQSFKVWNDISDDIRRLPLRRFEKNLKLILLENTSTGNSFSPLSFSTLIFIAFLTLFVKLRMSMCFSV